MPQEPRTNSQPNDQPNDNHNPQPGPSANTPPDAATRDDEVSQLRNALTRAEQRLDLERRLRRAGAIDPETAAVIAESIHRGDTPDAEQTVETLRRDKPFLFTRTTRAGWGMAPEPAARTERDEIESLAESARTTGDRRQLLDYLRRRRAR